MSNNLRELFDTEVLALTIYGEARGESIEGQVAVGCVIRNRVLHRNSDYKTVCWEPNQFSCWSARDPNYLEIIKISQVMLNHEKLDDAAARQCMWLAFGIANKSILDNTGGSQFYLTNKLYESETQPIWSKHLKVSKVIGNQTFLV